MPLSEREIKTLFVMLNTAGILPPESWQDMNNRKVAMETWMDLLDLTFEEAKAATSAYIRAGERFWPTPGAILGYGPRRELPDTDLLSPKNDRFERLHASLVAQGVPWLKATDIATRHLWMGEPIPAEYVRGAAA